MVDSAVNVSCNFQADKDHLQMLLQNQVPSSWERVHCKDAGVDIAIFLTGLQYFSGSKQPQ